MHEYGPSYGGNEGDRYDKDIQSPELELESEARADPSFSQHNQVGYHHILSNLSRNSK